MTHWLSAESLGFWQSAGLMNPEVPGHPPTPPASCCSIPSTSAHQSIPLSIDGALGRAELVLITLTTCWYRQLPASPNQNYKIIMTDDAERNRHQFVRMHKDTAVFCISRGCDCSQATGCRRGSNQELITTDREPTDKGVHLLKRSNCLQASTDSTH